MNIILGAIAALSATGFFGKATPQEARDWAIIFIGIALFLLVITGYAAVCLIYMAKETK